MICLDTNVIIVSFNNPASPVRTRINQARDDGIPLAVSAIVAFELWSGAAKSGHRQRNTERLVDFFTGPIQILPLDAEDAREAGDIRAALERMGKPIGPYDILIAAQARRRNALLATANTREFARVPGLNTEYWAA
jgi:tRNA(fMet)-specific endonuclease VapC